MIPYNSTTMNKQSISISVVIPAYNEEKRIVKTLKQVAKFMPTNFVNYEVTIYSDGSTDKTVQVASSFIKENHLKKFFVKTLPNNIGKGGTIKVGVLEAKKDWILIMDADSATPISDIDRLIRSKGDAEVVYGSRYLDKSLLAVKQPLSRRIIGRVGNLLARMVLGIKLVDTQCGFKMFSRRASRIIFPKTQITRWGWDLEVLVIAMANDIKIVEVPVSWRHIEGSKFRASRGVRQTFFELFTIRKNLREGKYK